MSNTYNKEKGYFLHLEKTQVVYALKTLERGLKDGGILGWRKLLLPL